MGVKKRFTATQVADAVKQAKGYVSKAADLLDCDPRTIYNYADQYEMVRDAIAAVREKRHDYVESKLMSRIDGEDTTAIIFYLKTQCKDRGYVERQEMTGKDGGPIESEQKIKPDLSKLSVDELLALRTLVAKTSNEATDA